jgi:hypothetical protein
VNIDAGPHPVLELEDDDPDLQTSQMKNCNSDLISDMGIHAKSLPIEMCGQLFKIKR